MNKKLRKKMIDEEIKGVELAKKTNISTRQLRRITNGHSNGSLNWWRRAAKVLNCEISDIIE